MFRELAIP
ncbi:hypothetical protein AX774_g5859, partial [Zancudomyces culisetae]